ncbi:MAG TPA: hypothetical protein VNO30_24085 [Kofleriaceae bacterium]|nr:hypothetical protein [Kofleriaceae bacterium]
MIRLSKALLIATSSLAMTQIASAQDAPTEGEAAPPPDGEAKPAPEPEPARDPGAVPLTLYKGKILIAGSTVNINLSADAVGKPISLAPSVWYGIDDKLTVGLTHDGGSTVWTPRPGFRTITLDILGMTVTGLGGAGICLTGDENGCSGIYDNVGVDALYSIKNERFSLAAHPGIDVFSFDPFTLSLRVGVLGRYLVNDKIAVVFDPRIKIGITERDFNKETIDVPIWAWYAINDKISAYLHTGFNAAFDGFGDTLTIPLQLGANFMVNHNLTVGLDFGFPAIDESADARVLGLRAAYAL